MILNWRYIVLVVLFAYFGVLTLGTTATAADNVIVVQPDQSIQSAIDDASHGDTIEVRPGTYDQRVQLDRNVTLVAPDGATLDGSGLPGEDAALRIRESVAPRVSGFTIEGYEIGVNARGTAGAWTLWNLTFSNVTRGIEASGTTGEWAVRRTTIRHPNNGLMAVGSTGEWLISNTTVISYGDDAVGLFASEGSWVIRDSVFRDSRGQGCSSNAVGVEQTSGAWTIADTRIIDSTCAAISAWNSTSDWTVRNVTISDAQFGIGSRFAEGNWTTTSTTISGTDVGVWAPHSTGDWTVRTTTVENSSGGVSAANASGDWKIRSSELRDYGRRPGLLATNTTGRWRVFNTSFLGDPPDIQAHGAQPAGDATSNWWGAESPNCIGNVTCTSLSAEAGSTPTPTTTPSRTPVGSRTPTEQAGDRSNEGTPTSVTTSTTGRGLSFVSLMTAFVVFVIWVLHRE